MEQKNKTENKTKQEKTNLTQLKKWGKRLKEIRKYLDLTSNDFAFYLKISTGSLSNYENGITWINGDLIEKIKNKISDITASHLIGVSKYPFVDMKTLKVYKTTIKNTINVLKEEII